MASKKTDKKEEVTKKEDKKTKTKTVEETPKVTEEKKTILQLIDESGYRRSYIIGALKSVNLSEEYKKELENQYKGLYIEPKLTTSEFNNIISNFLNRRL